MFRSIGAVLLSLFLIVLPYSLAGAENVRPGDAALVGEYGFGAEDIGYLVVDIGTGETVASYNSDIPFMPASSAKVLTISAALALLGPEHRFQTEILTARQDTADGSQSNLYLKGGGDPFLSGDNMAQMVAALAELGITKVDGDFIYDASHYLDQPKLNEGQPDLAGYNPGLSALSINFNRARLNWTVEADGDIVSFAAAVSESQEVPLAGFSVAPAGNKRTDHPRFLRTDGPTSESWVMSTHAPKKGAAWLPVADPAAMSAQVFRSLAKEAGITLPEPQPGSVPDNAEPLIVFDSPSLAAISKGILRYSNNMSAELVGMATSHRLLGVPVSMTSSTLALGQWLAEQLPETDWSEFDLDNHSGLSTATLVTPRQMVDVLVLSASEDESQRIEPYLKNMTSKAVGGRGGRVRAKTGTMDFVRGLAGYVKTPSDRQLAFAYFANDRAKRLKQDEYIANHSDSRVPGRHGWLKRARNLENALISRWSKYVGPPKPIGPPKPRPVISQ